MKVPCLHVVPTYNLKRIKYSLFRKLFICNIQNSLFKTTEIPSNTSIKWQTLLLIELDDFTQKTVYVRKIEKFIIQKYTFVQRHFHKIGNK